MKELEIKIKTVKTGKVPVFKHSGDACADCFARLEHPVEIVPGGRKKIPLGFCLQLPSTYEAQVRPRSGLSLQGVDVCFGTVDENYRGEVCAMVCNNSGESITVEDGMRIAQLAIRRTEIISFFKCLHLDDTNRGSNGFGSTGV